MNVLERKAVNAQGVKIIVREGDEEIGRAYVYILRNDLHEQPFAFLEDVFVSEHFRGRRIVWQILREVDEIAKENECYKIVATSRHERTGVHKLYLRAGYRSHGIEFRKDLETSHSEFQKGA